MQSNDQDTLGAIIASFGSKLSNAEFLKHRETVEQLDEFRAILEYLNLKGSRRRNYRHYGPRKKITSILDEACFYLTDGSSWNDRYDREHFNPSNSRNKRFGTCFSATTSESIAMWMLYGGIDGNGAMINFDKRTLDSAAANNEYECGYFEKDSFKTVETVAASDIDFKLIDMLYFGNDENNGMMTMERVGEKKDKSVRRDARWHSTNCKA